MQKINSIRNYLLKAFLCGGLLVTSQGFAAAADRNITLGLTAEFRNLLARFVRPAAAGAPVAPTTLTGWLATLPGQLDGAVFTYHKWIIGGALAAGGLYAYMTPSGPITSRSIDIHDRLAGAVDAVHAVLNEERKSPMANISDIVLALLQLRSALDTAVQTLPQKYDVSFFQTCRDNVDAILKDAQVAQAGRYAARQDKRFLSQLTKICRGMDYHISIEYLAGIQRSVNGESLGIPGYVAGLTQFVRHGFDPAAAMVQSGKSALHIGKQTVEDGVRALVGTGLSFDKREDQLYVLHKLRTQLLDQKDAAGNSWFKQLTGITRIRNFLNLFILGAKTNESVAMTLPVVVDNRVQADLLAQKTPVSPDAQRHAKNTVWKKVLGCFGGNSVLANVTTATAVCALVALGVRNRATIAKAVSATADAVWQQGQSAYASCVDTLSHVLSKESELAINADGADIIIQ